MNKRLRAEAIGKTVTLLATLFETRARAELERAAQHFAVDMLARETQASFEDIAPVDAECSRPRHDPLG